MSSSVYWTVKSQAKDELAVTETAVKAEPSRQLIRTGELVVVELLVSVTVAMVI
jgi:hypothetical protein